MSRMALAAAQGGAAGIRANSVADISAIKEIVSFRMIGIIKRDYPAVRCLSRPLSGKWMS